MAKIEIEYMRKGKPTGRRKKMRAAFVTPLEKMGLVKRVIAAAPNKAAKQGRPQKPVRVPVVKQAEKPDEVKPLSQPEPDFDDQAAPPLDDGTKKKRVYKRRDLTAEDKE